ncbi:hypothetical protein L3Y34_016406 [Caenorhabditis briggsae]|uniref:Uncharacterized protein n=1 Tax=Caenorhabditis briggsae TaxID=6238 RepID=A0AAE9E010_CAEBR|nr:hypothetical protein L3Y34_016406 [Caenorhabditis briggsae]
MAKTKVTAPQNTHVESKADIKKKIQLLGDEYITAIKDHQKASNDVRRIQSQQKESEKKIQRLKALHQMHQKPKPAFQKKIQEKEEAHKKIQKQLKKPLKVEESANDAMEEAEVCWKFEAMCSGEAYQEDGQWKWRE